LIDEAKAQRIVELMKQRDKIDAEINALTGAEPPQKRKWTRRTNGQSPEAPDEVTQ
jgi:hypothetical protein